MSEKLRHTCTSIENSWTNEQNADLKWLWRHMVVTKIAKKKKNQEKANNSLSYRCEAIKNFHWINK